MALSIKRIAKEGSVDKEYVLLVADADCDTANYMICDTTYDANGEVSNLLRHAFWFPSVQVKKGEYVSLRSGKGAYSKATLNSGEPVHRFHWGLKTCVWNNTGDVAVLLKVKDIEASEVP